jgi:hypothetical protein
MRDEELAKKIIGCFLTTYLVLFFGPSPQVERVVI